MISVPAEQSSAVNDSVTSDAFSLEVIENQTIYGLNCKDIYHLTFRYLEGGSFQS